LDDSDDEDDFKADQPKPKAKRKTPPKKQLVSLGSNFGSSKDKAKSSSVGKKSSSDANVGLSDEYVDDSVEKQICKLSAPNAKSNRGRRSRANISYADESSEEEIENINESDDELDEPEISETKRISNSTRESKMKMLEDEVSSSCVKASSMHCFDTTLMCNASHFSGTLMI
jgi:hypothetical protein